MNLRSGLGAIGVMGALGGGCGSSGASPASDAGTSDAMIDGGTIDAADDPSWTSVIAP